LQCLPQVCACDAIPAFRSCGPAALFIVSRRLARSLASRPVLGVDRDAEAGGSEGISSRHHVVGKRLEADLVSRPAWMLQRRADVPAFGARSALPDQVA